MNEKINMLKGLGLLLVVLDHTGAPTPIVEFNHMFAAPLFFFTSGYCFKQKYTHDLRTFVGRKVKGLYIPFVKYMLLFILLHNLFCALHVYDPSVTTHGKVSVPYGMAGFAVAAAKALLFIPTEPLLGAYWFLPQLFISSIISVLMLRYIKRAELCLAISAAAAFALLFLPSGICGYASRSLTATAFFLIGHIWRGHERHISVAAAIALLCATMIGSRHFSAEMSHLTPMNFIPYYVCYTTAVLGLWRLLDFAGVTVSTFLGSANRHAMPILTWHMPCFLIPSYIIVTANSYPIERLASFPVIHHTADSVITVPYWPIYFMAGIGIPMLAGYIKRRTSHAGNK